MHAARTYLAGLGLAALLLGACDQGSYSVWIEHDWSSLSVSAWDADVDGCHAWYPRPPAAVPDDSDPRRLECIDAIDEILIHLPGWDAPISNSADHSPGNHVYAPPETGSTIFVTIRGRYGDQEIALPVPPVRPEFTGTIEVSDGDAAVTWSAPAADLVCTFVNAPTYGRWVCGPDSGRVEIPPAIDRDTMYIKRLWNQVSSPNVSIWERQTVFLDPTH